MDSCVIKVLSSCHSQATAAVTKLTVQKITLTRDAHFTPTKILANYGHARFVYLFILQSQFVILFFYCIRSVVTDCGFAKWMCLLMIGYAITLLTLFLNFYIRTYLLKDNAKRNGTLHNGTKKTN